jgi:hypothetical protein
MGDMWMKHGEILHMQTCSQLDCKNVVLKVKLVITAKGLGSVPVKLPLNLTALKTNSTALQSPFS